MIIRKFRVAWKEQGAMWLIRYVFRRKFPVHISYVYLKTDISSLCTIPGLSVERYPLRSAVGSEIIDSLKTAGHYWLIREMDKLFSRGCQLWLGRLEGEIAGICWSRSGQNRTDYFVHLGERDATILSCFVFPAFRGRGIYPAMLETIVNVLMDQHSICSVYIDCKSWNTPSIRGIQKADFCFVGQFLRMMLFGRKIFHYPHRRTLHEKSDEKPADFTFSEVYGKRGIPVRLFYLLLAAVWYVATLGGRLSRRKGVVLCYHGIRSEQKERFERQVKYIASRAKPASQGVQRDKVCPRDFPVLFTFDDAFANLLSNALPAIESYSIPAIIFAVPGNSGQKPKWRMPAGHPEIEETVMTAQQLKRISSENIIIGSHTQNHPDLAGLLPDIVRKELLESKNTLEQLLQKPVEDLALPHGSYNPDVLEIARQTGYKRIYTLDPCLLRGQKERGVIGRFSMSPDVWPIEFSLTCVGAYQWLGPWRRMVRSLRKLFS